MLCVRWRQRIGLTRVPPTVTVADVPADSIPRLETPRLVLRGWRQTDIESYAAMLADPEVMRFLGGPVDRAEAWRRMAMHAGHWSVRGYGNWAVERRADGVLLGRAGLWEPDGWPGLEVGWMLGRGAWGHGYATEAARSAMDWTWSTLDAARLISIIHPENDASANVARRLGMQPQRDDVLLGAPVVIYGVERPAT